MLYVVLKHLHITAVIVSGLLFIWRGLRAMLGYSNNGFVYRVLPHIVDTILLASAIYLAYLMHQYPFVHAWLTAKVIGLVLFIVFGYMAIKKAKDFLSRFFYFVLALAMYLYIIGVAHYHHVLSWYIRYQ